MYFISKVENIFGEKTPIKDSFKENANFRKYFFSFGVLKVAEVHIKMLEVYNFIFHKDHELVARWPQRKFWWLDWDQNGKTFVYIVYNTLLSVFAQSEMFVSLPSTYSFVALFF